MSEKGITAATEKDVERILSIQEKCGLSAWSRAEYMEEIARRRSIFLVARSSSGVVQGFILGRVVSGAAIEAPSEAEIYNIGVMPDQRRRGYGGMLLGSFLDRCHEGRVAKVWLEVRASNVDAKAFYSDRGFLITGRRPAFYSNPIEDADLMCLDLSRRALDQTKRGA